MLAALTSPAVAEDPASFFAGKTLKIIVGLPPGGADADARLMQRHLPRHLPGAPAIVVENVPGADPAFSSDAEKMHLSVTPMDGEKVAHDIAALDAAPADLLAAPRRSPVSE